MDVLKDLHNSVAQIFDDAFDAAYRDLYADITSRDKKVEEAEKKAKGAEEARDEFAAEARKLRDEIAILREELVRNDATAEGTQIAAGQVSKLEEMFSPQRTLFFGDNDTACDPGLASKKEIVEKYTALYNELMTLLKATDGLRVQIKRHKRKLTYWRDCLDRDEFTLVLDGIPVKFERTQPTGNESQIQKPTRCHDAQPSPSVVEDPRKSGSKLHSKPSSTQLRGHCEMSTLNPRHEMPTQGLLPCDPAGSVVSPALPAATNNIGNENVSSKADNSREPRTSKKRCLESGMSHEEVQGRSLKHALSSIAEDGDEVSHKRRMGNLPLRALSEAKCSQLQPSEDAALTERRLHQLLESPLPPRHSLQRRKSVHAGAHGADYGQHQERGLTKPGGIDTSDIKPTPAETEESHESSAQLKLPSGLTSRANDSEVHRMCPADEPYRARPLHRLDLSHFKINPNFNHGLDFAFDDVVRKRHERDSIQGCTRPDCCGQKFLAMARLGGLPNDQTKCPNEDKKIIEDFLGEDKGIIDRMTAAEYQDILYEAKARLMTNQYGRHRHHHQRPSTPPGFWRADMPDTQEMEYDREEALKMERDKVQERYRQAMRPGGLWKFADE